MWNQTRKDKVKIIIIMINQMKREFSDNDFVLSYSMTCNVYLLLLACRFYTLIHKKYLSIATAKELPQIETTFFVGWGRVQHNNNGTYESTCDKNVDFQSVFNPFTEWFKLSKLTSEIVLNLTHYINI